MVAHKAPKSHYPRTQHRIFAKRHFSIKHIVILYNTMLILLKSIEEDIIRSPYYFVF